MVRAYSEAVVSHSYILPLTVRSVFRNLSIVVG